MNPSKNEIPEILIVAGEASSALYAQRLLEYWRDNNISVKAFGVGSDGMEAIGFERFGRSEEMAVVGITEVLRHFKKIRGVFHRLVEEASVRRPRVVLLLDYPDFNLRLAKRMKALGLQVVYYISPQIWAWRKSRINLIKKYVDKMLVVLPFEKDFYAKHGVDVEFVGHPLLDELDRRQFNLEERKIERQKFGIKDDEMLVGLMPGSRLSELKHHFLTQIEVAGRLVGPNEKLKFALLVAPTFSIDEIKTFLPPLNLQLQIIRDDPLNMVNLVDVVLTASGTATLLVGLMEKPMVIMYKMNPLTAFLAKLFVKGTSHFGLINLVLAERVVPEYFQGDASVEALSASLSKLIKSNNERMKIVEKLRKAKSLLGSKGATRRVANELKGYLFPT